MELYKSVYFLEKNIHKKYAHCVMFFSFKEVFTKTVEEM